MDIVNNNILGTGEVRYNSQTGLYTMVADSIQELPMEYPIVPKSICSVIYGPDETLQGFVVIDFPREYREVARWYPRFMDEVDYLDEDTDEDDPMWYHWDDDEWLDEKAWYVPAARMFMRYRVQTLEYMLNTNLPWSSWVPGYQEVTGDVLEVQLDSEGKRLAVRSTASREYLNNFDERNGPVVHVGSLLAPGTTDVRARQYVRLPRPDQMNG